MWVHWLYLSLYVLAMTLLFFLPDPTKPRVSFKNTHFSCEWSEKKRKHTTKFPHWLPTTSVFPEKLPPKLSLLTFSVWSWLKRLQNTFSSPTHPWACKRRLFEMVERVRFSIPSTLLYWTFVRGGVLPADSPFDWSLFSFWALLPFFSLTLTKSWRSWVWALSDYLLLFSCFIVSYSFCTRKIPTGSIEHS